MSINCSPEGSPVEDRIHYVVDQSQCMSFLLNVILMIVDWCDAGQATRPIDILSDDDLLFVFDFYVAQASEVEEWHTLVHVCRRWRILVFESPSRLNLKIECTPVREKLDIWPALPIAISGTFDLTSHRQRDNIEAIFKHHDRVCIIVLGFTLTSDLRCGLLEDVFATLEESFPLLTYLVLEMRPDVTVPPIYPNRDKFLGGSTHLQSLSLTRLPIPRLPKLLLSSTDLIYLHLEDIPYHGYFSPDAMVTTLSVLTRLKVLHFTFIFDYRFPHHPDWISRRLPPLERTVLPSLTELRFLGDTDYVEDFLTRIDAPLLDNLHVAIVCIKQLQVQVDLDISRLLQFISRIPNFQAPDKAQIGVDTNLNKLWINFSWAKQISNSIWLGIYCRSPEWEIPRLLGFCRPPFSPLPTLEYLCIGRGTFSPETETELYEKLNINLSWLEFLIPFTTVKNLYLTTEFAPLIAYALQELVGEEMAALPAMENIFIDNFEPSGSVHAILKEFVAARHLSGHPLTISRWDTNIIVGTSNTLTH